MADTAGQVLVEARGLLNDLSGSLYTDDSLLPLLNKAYRELQDHYRLNGLGVTKEAPAIVTVNAGDTSIAAPPADMLRPIELGERTPGTTETFATMDEKSWEPDELPSVHLRIWVWREEMIQFLGATTNREVRIRYAKSLSSLASVNAIIGIANSLTFLAARTASLAARYIGENPNRADALELDAREARDLLIVTAIRQNQGKPTRRRRSRYRVY